MMQEKLKQVADKLGASLMKGFGCNQYLVFGDPTNPESLKLLVYPLPRWKTPGRVPELSGHLF